MNSYIGKIRLVKQEDLFVPLPHLNNKPDQIGTIGECIPQPPKLQQFDGKDWVDVEIVDLVDKVTI